MARIWWYVLVGSAAACVCSLNYLAGQVSRHPRRLALSLPGGALLLLGTALYTYYWMSLAGAFDDMGWDLVISAILAGLPSVPMSAIVAVVNVRARRQRNETSARRAREALRAWRQKQATKRQPNQAPAAEAQQPPASAGDTTGE